MRWQSRTGRATGVVCDASNFLGRVPVAAVRRALAEDAFFCATHWNHHPRVVRPALKELLEQPLDTNIFSFVAAEFWLWATKVSPGDRVWI